MGRVSHSWVAKYDPFSALFDDGIIDKCLAIALIALQDTDNEVSVFHLRPSGTHTAADRVSPITDTDSVLYTLEDRVVLQRLCNSATVTV